MTGRPRRCLYTGRERWALVRWPWEGWIKEEGRGKREEGREKREEGRGKREEGTRHDTHTVFSKHEATQRHKGALPVFNPNTQ